MQVRKYGNVIFDKVSKEFHEGEGCFVDEMPDAFIYNNYNQAKEEIETFDEPERYEVWNLEIVYRTVDD